MGSKLKSVDSLLSFPFISIHFSFMKINFTLPSYAAVERLFSAAAQVLMRIAVVCLTKHWINTYCCGHSL